MKFLLPLCVCAALFSGCADLKTAKFNAKSGNVQAAWADWVTLAEAGYPEAMVELGSLYMKGTDVPKSPTLAVELFEKAAAQGDAKAYFELGKAYEKGEGVIKDGHKAIEFYQLAASAGNVRGWQAEGQLFAKGKLVNPNAGKAERLLLAAIDQGNARAGFDYAELMIDQGRGLEAAKYYEWALQQGYARAGLKLAEYYSEAGVLPHDPVRAYAYYLLAHKVQAKNPDADAALELPKKIVGIEATTTASDKDLAQSLADLIMPEKTDQGFRIELANHAKSKNDIFSASDEN